MNRATLRISGSSKRGATEVFMPTGNWSPVKPAGTVAAGRLTSVIR